VNAGAALDARTQAVFASIWLEGLGDLPIDVLRAAFLKTLQECAYWPVKVADIRKHVARAESNATDEAAEQAWRRVLEIRRVHWNPDIPGPFNRALARLSERVRQAARAAGVWRDFTSAEFEKGALHTWGKKRFFESFIAWGEREQNQFLLPDGELKSLLAEFSETKALPAPEVDFHALHERGLRYAEQNKLLDTYNQASRDLPAWEPEKRTEVDAELRNYGDRFKAAMENRQAAYIATVSEPQAVEV